MTLPLDWDSPNWGGRVHKASNGSWLDADESGDHRDDSA